MTSDILTQFSALPPRETAGSSSSNRFDYQKNWSICHFLELHQDGKDYLVVFDHHEDTVVFDHRTTPDSACFYQVKSKEGLNNRGFLLRRPLMAANPAIQTLFSHSVSAFCPFSAEMAENRRINPTSADIFHRSVSC